MNLFHDVCFHYQKHIKYPTKFISMQMKFESLNRCPTLYYFVTSGFMTSKMVVLASQRALFLFAKKFFLLKWQQKHAVFFCNEFLTPRLSNLLYLATKPQTFHKSSNNSLWKRVIAWERSRTASVYGIIWGTQVKTNIVKFSAECHSVDCSGDSKV